MFGFSWAKLEVGWKNPCWKILQHCLVFPCGKWNWFLFHNSITTVQKLIRERAQSYSQGILWAQFPCVFSTIISILSLNMKLFFLFTKNFNSYSVRVSHIYFELLTYFPKEFCGPSVLQTLVDLRIVLTPPAWKHQSSP